MMNRRLTPGKLRRLQTAASPAGVFRILAIDHRGVLLRMMDPHGGGHVPAERVTRIKLDVVREVGPLTTAVILDPQYGALQAIACGALPGHVGLLTPLESEPRAAGPGAPGEDRPAWSVRQACQIGASGVKLYLSYHPDADDRTRAQEDLVRDVVRQCAEEDMPLFLEPVARSLDPDAPIGSARFARQRRHLSLRIVERLGALGPDVLKLQFPVDGRHETDEAVWRTACAELNDASPVPWALLSAGDPFEIFKAQLQVACEAGASGFMAGRALWSEVATAEEPERRALLTETVLPRMQELNQIADRYSHDWRERGPFSTIDRDGPGSV
jgi:tagatose 1,6-diphosphate aldolase